MISPKTKYGIASLLCTGNLGNLESRINQVRSAGLYSQEEVDERIEFARSIDKYFKVRDGFVPKKVVDLCK